MDKTSRLSKVLFTCIRCSKEVSRLGKKVREKSKICGGCNGKKNHYTPKGIVPTTNDVMYTINKYRKKLDRAEQLHKQNPLNTFIELWSRLWKP